MHLGRLLPGQEGVETGLRSLIAGAAPPKFVIIDDGWQFPKVSPKPGTAEHYRSSMQFPKVSPGVMENEPGMKTDVLTVQGLGLVHPRAVYRFYYELHAYLAAAGVDGVKVDVQCILETLGARRR